MEEHSRLNPSEQQELFLRDKLNNVLESCGLDPANYQVTTKPYNIGLVHGMSPRGFDIINSQTNERTFITSGSDVNCEKVARNKLGTTTVLEHLEDLGPNREYQQYRIPEGAQLYVDLYGSSRITDEYAVSLRNKAMSFLLKLNLCDPFAFGITKENLVVIDLGDVEAGRSAKEAVIAVVPPMIYEANRYHPMFVNQPLETQL